MTVFRPLNQIPEIFFWRFESELENPRLQRAARNYAISRCEP